MWRFSPFDSCQVSDDAFDFAWVLLSAEFEAEACVKRVSKCKPTVLVLSRDRCTAAWY
jgi:hypothetical protein